MGAGRGYAERATPGALGAWSPCVWVHEGAEAALVVPDGCVDLVWIGGRLTVAGPDSAPRRVAVAPGGPVAGVRLAPGAAPILLGAVPATAVLDAQPDLASLWGPAALLLQERVAGAGGPWEAARLLARALDRRLARFGPDPVAVAAAKALDRPRPPSVAALARGMGFSERQLRRRVAASAGYGPKTLEQILRFRRAEGGVREGGDLARVAAEAGYADQAHLSRQVRRWSGVRPRDLPDAA